MRQLILVITLGLSQISGRAQKLSYDWKSNIAPASCMVLAGVADSWNQVLQFKYPSFKKAFPGINDKWYNPKISGANKYKGGIKANGERFIGSKTVFVAVTDAYHFSRFLEHFFVVGAISFKVGQPKKKWYIYAGESLGYLLLYRASFSMVYNSFK